MEDEIFIEKWCSMCGKLSWDSQSGYYNETHVNPRNGANYPCNMNGTRAESTNDGVTTFYYVDGTVKKYRDGLEVEGE